MNPKIFICHSSQDKSAVRKLASELKRRGLTVWFDEKDIRVGQSIAQRIQEGLVQCDYLCIWLTKNSIESGWVAKEWQSRIQEEISSHRTMILPALAEECCVPPFLADKRYADFRTSFEDGVEQLVDALDREAPKNIVTRYLNGLIDELRDVVIPIPYHSNIKLVERLERIPRSGKVVRLRKFYPQVPVRSLYDHLLSIAHSCDVLMPHLSLKIRLDQAQDLARCIAYHDLCEIFLGDIPTFTNLTMRQRIQTEIRAEHLLRRYPSDERDRITNSFISMFLEDREQHSLDLCCKILADNTNPLRKLFVVMDKMDAIVAVWRYVYWLKDKDIDSELFLQKLKNFFEYDGVREAAITLQDNNITHEIIMHLQDQELALSYAKGEPALDKIDEFVDLPRSTMRQLIEGRSFHFANTHKKNSPD
jgi:5'-deoxynucleotidase YfbR-like HD superfamily hydrolase